MDDWDCRISDTLTRHVVACMLGPYLHMMAAAGPFAHSLAAFAFSATNAK